MKLARKSTALAAALLGALALAGTAADAEIIRTSDVFTRVTDNGNGTYTYEYTVRNTSPGNQSQGEFINVWPTIVDYEVPIDDPSVLIGDVLSPAEWAHELLSADEFLLRYGVDNPFNSAWVLHWCTGFACGGVRPTAATVSALVIDVGNRPIVPRGYRDAFPGSNVYEPEASGFAFTSNLSPVDGPYSASWEDDVRRIGDPPLPGGAPLGQGLPPFRQIPEPGTLFLFAAGAAIGLRRYFFRRPA